MKSSSPSERLPSKIAGLRMGLLNCLLRMKQRENEATCARSTLSPSILQTMWSPAS